MEFGECPSSDIWNKRASWTEKKIEDANIRGFYALSDHATTLFMDMQLAFCAGAWISVVIMSVSVIDAHLRETEAMDNSIGTALLLDKYYEGENINLLRKLRNTYVHHNLDKPSFEMNDWYNKQEQLEKHAQEAMQMTILALFQGFGV